MKKEDKKITPIGGNRWALGLYNSYSLQINYSSCTAFCQGRRPKKCEQKEEFSRVAYVNRRCTPCRIGQRT